MRSDHRPAPVRPNVLLLTGGWCFEAKLPLSFQFINAQIMEAGQQAARRCPGKSLAGAGCCEFDQATLGDRQDISPARANVTSLAYGTGLLGIKNEMAAIGNRPPTAVKIINRVSFQFPLHFLIGIQQLDILGHDEQKPPVGRDDPAQNWGAGRLSNRARRNCFLIPCQVLWIPSPTVPLIFKPKCARITNAAKSFDISANRFPFPWFRHFSDYPFLAVIPHRLAPWDQNPQQPVRNIPPRALDIAVGFIPLKQPYECSVLE